MEVEINPRTPAIIAHLNHVQETVTGQGKAIRSRAEALLAAHRRSGDAHIDLHHDRPDVLVSLVDKAALSIEFDHIASNGRVVEGLAVLRKAAGLR